MHNDTRGFTRLLIPALLATLMAACGSDGGSGSPLNGEMNPDPATPNPTDPAPTDPTDPTDPDPVDPTDPTDPDPVDPTDPEPVASAEACLNPDLLSVGTRYVRAADIFNGSMTILSETVVARETSFDGRMAIEVVSSNFIGDAGATLPDSSGAPFSISRDYFQRSAPEQSLLIGIDFEQDGAPTVSYYDPGVLFSFDLEVSDSVTSAYTSGELFNGQRLEDGDADETLTFVGIENVTVPAGTFEACRFTQTVPAGGGGNSDATLWIERKSGLVLKKEGTPSFNSGDQAALNFFDYELRFASLNGVPIDQLP